MAKCSSAGSNTSFEASAAAAAPAAGTGVSPAVEIEPQSSLEEIVSLLTDCALPVADISADSPGRFFGIRVDGALVAVVGLELYPPAGLLRSLAVASPYRGRGLGRMLVAFAESFCAAHGVHTVFLLTTTAERFFRGLGYLPLSRDQAPPAIRATLEFAGLCPRTSALLSKCVGA